MNIFKYRNAKRSHEPRGGDHAGRLRDFPFDDTDYQVWLRERIIQCDVAFQTALDRAISDGLERCSTAIHVEPCTKWPIFVADGDIRFQ
jgi:hypothetical protein